MHRFDVTVLSSFPFCLQSDRDRPNRFRLAPKILAALFAWTLLSLSPAQAQTGPAPAVSDQLGIIPYQSYHGGDIDSINLSSGKINIRIPLISYPQRGGLLRESFFATTTANPSAVTSLPCQPDFCPLYGWRGGFGVPGISEDQPPIAGSVSVGVVITGVQNYYWYGRLLTPDGASHLVGQTGGPVRGTNPTPSGTSYRTLDGSGYSFGTDASGNWTTFDASGIKYSGTTREDPNGNQITVSSNSVTDTLGRNIPLPTNTTASDSSSCPQGGTLLPISSATLWSPPGLNGGTFQVKLCYALISNNLPSTVTILGNSAQVIGFRGSLSILQSVVFLANNTAWTFEYNDQDGTMNNGSPVNWGSLTKITMPTGGTISYGYGWGGSTADLGSRWVTSRTVNANDGTGNHTWNYAYGVTTVTDPLGNDTVHTFTGYGTGTYYETQTQYYQGSKSSNVLLKTIATQYLSNVSPGAGGAASVFPSKITTTWPNGQVQQVTKSYDSGFSYVGNSANAYYGRVLNETDSDFGTNGAGAPLRTIATNYQFLQNSNYLTNNMLNLVSNVKVSDGNGNQRSYVYYNYDENAPIGSGVTKQHDATPPAGTYRGNQTSVHRWLNGSTKATTNCNVSVSNGYLVSSKIYFDTGEVQKSTDPCGYWTTYQYTATAPNYGAFLTTATNILTQSTNYGYDSNTGLLTSFQDPNLQTTTKHYDIMNRPTLISYPDGGSTSYCYTDMGGCSQTTANSVVITKAITSSLSEISTLVFDGLGRLSQTQLNSDPIGTTSTLTTYDALGRKSQVYNPTRCSPITTNCGTTWGYSTYNYDPVNRVTSVVEQDGSTISTSYAAFPCTTVTDEAGKARQSCVDGLGRMTSVLEDPGSSPHLNYQTLYLYDALDNLTNVTQNGSNSAYARTRTFTYDSLSQLGSAQNPESGTVSYTYDADGNPVTKTTPLPNQTGSSTVTTTSTYDKLNRLVGKSYSDGTTPWNTYAYDQTANWTVTLKNGVGRLTGQFTCPSGILGPACGTTAASTTGTIFSYDAVGRAASTWQCTPSTCGTASFWLGYTYNLAGNLTSITNTGNALTYGPYDAADRLTKITSSLNDSQHPGTLYSVDPSVGYYPMGGLRKASLGNGLTETLVFNNRLQPCRMNVNSTSSYFSYCTDATPSGNILDLTFGYNAGSSDNGNVASWSAVGNQIFSRTYTYDPLNRLQSMSDSASGQACKGLSWTIDAWSNMTAQTTTAGTCYGFLAAVGTNNQLQTGFQYDAAGNMLFDGSHYYSYDAENRILQVDSGSTAGYVYDAKGSRIRKNAGSTWTEYIYGPQGSVEREWNGTSYPVQYIYVGNRLIAEYTNSTTEFVHTDQLGSTRLVTGVTQAVLDNMDYLPFGQQIAGASASTHKFTGKERDSESGLDNFGARYYASSLGRFMTPDPMGGHQEDPQTLNKYAYVRNNPTTLTDPTGLDSYLQCQQASSTCASQTVGRDKDGNAQTALVQGVTNSDKSFTATLIGNANPDGSGGLVDKTTGTGAYTASVNGDGVQFSNNGGQSSSSGVFVNGTPQTTFQDAGFANGGALSGFSFTLTNSKMEANQTEAGFFSFRGTVDQAGQALEAAGFGYHTAGFDLGSNEYRSSGQPGTGANAGHFAVNRYHPLSLINPLFGVPTTLGNMHFGEHNPFAGAGAAWEHAKEQ